jgi:outer membrane protein
MMEPLRAKLNEAIATVAREKKLALVVNTDANACPFIDPEMGIDIQEPVILMLTK